MTLDFSFLLVLATAATGLIALIDTLFWAEKRRQRIRAIEHEIINNIAQTKGGSKQQSIELKAVRKRQMPVIVDYSRSLFPVFFVVLIIRSFFFEPYQIPSGSMLPTLRIGDFILVNKFSFGVRLPVINVKILPGREPQPGDVLVFRAPFEPQTNYIKRVIGVPGDTIAFRNSMLYVNNRQVPQGMVTPALNPYKGYQMFQQSFDDKAFLVLKSPHYSTPDGQWTVPEKSYFVLGDNRGNSYDSRFWGFVPDRMIVGRAMYVWMHWEDFFSIPGFSGTGVIDDNLDYD